MQFRAEFFNLFNHPHFYLPGTSAASMQDVDSPSSFRSREQHVERSPIHSVRPESDFLGRVEQASFDRAG